MIPTPKVDWLALAPTLSLLGAAGVALLGSVLFPAFARRALTAVAAFAGFVVAGIFAELLGLSGVGARDGFFDLGGHSLLATRLASRVQAAFAVEVPLRLVFTAPTVAELAACVEEMRRADLPVLPDVVPVPRTGPLPLSFAQERMWFLDRMEPAAVEVLRTAREGRMVPELPVSAGGAGGVAMTPGGR